MSASEAPEPERRALRVFWALLVVLCAVVYVPVIRAGTLDALGGLAVPLLMWAPGVSGMIASLVAFRSLRRCGFGLGRRTVPWLAVTVVVPVAYTLAIHLPLQALGLVKLGGPDLSPGFLGGGFVGSLLFATGEEIGWRGFLAPLMMQRYGFLRGNLLIGGVWALYHFPAILFADYGQAGNPIVGLVLFTVAVTALSVCLGATRMASGSLWPAAVYHATHNLLFLHLFDPVEKRSRVADWLMGEQGVLLCVVLVLLALVVVRRYSADPAAPERAGA